MRFAVALVVLTLAARAGAQPPDNWGFFGNNPKQKFDEKAFFKEPPKTPGAPPVPPLKEIPDGAPPPPPPPKVWTGGLEFGLNGSQADVDILNIKLGAFADRKVEGNRFHYDFLYTLTRQNSDSTQNQALLNARDEILFRGTPWSVFAALQLEYDEFRAFDLRVGAYVGAGYTWIESDTTLFKTRAGAGAVREMSTRRGGPRDRWVPEAVFGFDFNHKFTDRQSFLSALDIYPSLERYGQYRVRARAAYEIVLDPEHGMVLRLGAQERYDSHPGTGPRNALNYFVTLLFKF
jgi:Protein of unknown function, DUF481